MLLRGETAVITGAASGLGREIASTFAREGANLVLLDLNAEEVARVAAELAGEASVEATSIGVDISDADAVEAAFATLDASGVTPTILVNSAGIREIAGPLELPAAEWQRVMDVNLSGTFYCAQAAAKRMAPAGRGAIVNLAAVGGFVAFGNRPAYTASKHAVVGITRSLATDLGPSGIRVNAVCPGLMKTPFTTAFFEDEEFVSRLPITIPLGRPGLPPDVAQAALFLASPMASYITGVALPVDGGFLAGGTFEVRSQPTSFNQRMGLAGGDQEEAG